MSKYWKQLPEGHSTYSIASKAIYVPVLNAWLTPVELPEPYGWPAPRDTKTDPPNDSKRVLVFYANAGQWQITSTPLAEMFSHWANLPPVPLPAKTEAERAWEAHAKPGDCRYLDYQASKALFIKGFEAGRGGK